MKTLFIIFITTLWLTVSARKLDTSYILTEVVLSYEAPLIGPTYPLDSAKYYAHNIDVKIVNVSGYDIDSLVLGKTYIGEVGNGETVDATVEGIITINSTGEPRWLNAVLRDSTNISSTRVVSCGTGVKILKSGAYTFYLVRVDWGYGYQVNWSTVKE
jgi:hypothetical protein